jgi:hypothetical protein
MQNEKYLWLIVLLLVTVGAVAVWHYGPERATGDAEPAEQPDSEIVETAPEGPLYPLQPEDAGEEPQRELRPLPPLEESDEYFKLELVDLFGEASEELIVSSGLIERVVATVDNLPRQRVSERIRPLTGLEEPFVADDGRNDDGQYTLSERNYQRYDQLTERFVTADPQQVVDLYRRFYPLFQKAYAEQGYPDGYFNDRLVEVIDHLLVTPDVEEPIRLTRPHVLYQFADPELESLSGGQKLMLRLGPSNREGVKKKLRELRALIADA